MATDRDLGVPAVRALAEGVAGRAATSTTWAPPPIQPRSEGRWNGELIEPDTAEEAEARNAALALLPEGSSPMNVDSESFGGIQVWAAVVQLPDGTGLAGVGLSAAEAWEALAARLQGTLEESAVWLPALPA